MPQTKYGYVRPTALIAPLISDTTPRPLGSAPKPAYLAPSYDPILGTKITRITGDYLAPILTAGGAPLPNTSNATWGNCARHHYSLDQAWNADESMLYLENNTDPDATALGVPDASSPNGHLFLDGQTYQPLFYQGVPGDVRWHVSEPSLMYYANGNTFGLWRQPRTF